MRTRVSDHNQPCQCAKCQAAQASSFATEQALPVLAMELAGSDSNAAIFEIEPFAGFVPGANAFAVGNEVADEEEAEFGRRWQLPRRATQSTRRTPPRPLRRRPQRRWPPRRRGSGIVGVMPTVIEASPGDGQGSEYVRWVQNTLNQIMDLQLPVDGVMGRATRSAIRSFQQQQGLPVDGIVGPDTERAMLAARGGDRPTADDAPPQEAEFGWEAEVKPGSPDYLRWVQQALNQLLGLRLTVDGKLGPQTRSAIRSFQQQRGLTVDGKVGPQTEAALKAALARTPLSPTPTTPARGRPGAACEVLTNFDFDRDQLKAEHRAKLGAVAKKLADSQRSTRPIRLVTIIGHTDPVGSDAYNVALGKRRADRVAGELRTLVEGMAPGSSKRMTLRVESRGEREPVSANAAQNRRVEICYTQPATPATNPPDHNLCGVPRSANEIDLEFTLHELEEELAQETGRVTVRPRLCIYQNTSETSARNHFNCQATRWARRIAAIRSPDAANCRRRVGSTPYDTGADIIRAIEAAQQCLARRVEAVHIFSHSGYNGVYGTVTGGSVGLYQELSDATSRSAGGRAVTDIPTAALAANVVFVLHGCNAASGSDNVAKSLYEHLAASLDNPRVFGHTNGGCAGRDNSWREYSNAAPAGRRVRSIAPHYSGNGCCS